MLAYFARRILIAVPLLVAVLFATFCLLYALPGDPVDALLGRLYTPQRAAEIRQREGLDDPLLIQFGRYMGDVFLRGDLGTNQAQTPVAGELADKVPATFELAILAMVLALIFGVAAGVISALKPRSWRDMCVLGAALAGVSLPIFWLGLIVKRMFGNVGEFAAGGRLSEQVLSRVDAMTDKAQIAGDSIHTTGFYLFDALFVFGDWAMFLDALEHLALPALVLSTVPAAFITRITRTAVGEQLQQDYVRTAKAKGLGGRRIIWRHVLRNAGIPILTSAGTMLGYLTAGAVLTETIFEWPGLGRYIVEAIEKNDVRPLQGAVLIIAVSFIVINLMVDLSYALIDPRVRLEGGEPT